MFRTRNVVIAIGLALLLIGWLTTSGISQSTIADIAITYHQAIASEDGEVDVVAVISVIDKAGQPVSGLQLFDFAVKEAGVTQIDALKVQQPVAIPLAVTFLIDNSDSMATVDPNGVRYLDLVKDGATRFIETLGNDDWVRVLAYNRFAQPGQSLTLDHNRAIDQGVFTIGVTEVVESCLYDSLLEIINDSDPFEGRQAVIVLTANPNSNAGCNNTTLSDINEAVEVSDSSRQIFAVALGENVDLDNLSLLTGLTSGYAFDALDGTTVNETIDLIVNHLQQAYQINYPSQHSDGLARLEVTVIDSDQTGRANLSIPKRVQPTSTPLPQFDISFEAQFDPEVNQLELTVDIPSEMTPIRGEVRLNEGLLSITETPPFDRYTIDLDDLGESGNKVIQVKITDQSGVMASSERALEIQLPPTPAPTVIAEPTPVPVSPPPSHFPALLPIILVGVGGLLILGLIGVIAMLIWRRQPQTQPPPATTPTVAPVAPMITVDDDSDQTLFDQQYRTVDAGDDTLLAMQAKLHVLEGKEFLQQADYAIEQIEVAIGRDAGSAVVNDIAIDKDYRAVSRSHAKLFYRNGRFYLQDQGSKSGTKINGQRLEPLVDVLINTNDEIQIGPKIKLRFEYKEPLDDKTVDDEPMGDLTEDEGGNDADETLYDLGK